MNHILVFIVISLVMTTSVIITYQRQQTKLTEIDVSNASRLAPTEINTPDPLPQEQDG